MLEESAGVTPQPTKRLVSSLLVVLVVAVVIAGTLGYFAGASNKQTLIQSETATVSLATATLTFNYSSMPSEFMVGGYAVTMGQATTSPV